MGRPGAGGGGRSGGGGSRSGRSSSGRSGRSMSMSRSSGSSRPSGGFGGSSYRGPAPRAPRPPRPPRRTYYSRPRTRTVYRNGGSSSGCSTVLAWLIVLFIVFVVLANMGMFGGAGGFGNSYASNTIDVDVVAENAETYYNNNVMIPNSKENDEKAFLFYFTYLEEADADEVYYLPGYDVDYVFTDSVYDAFDKAYIEYFNEPSVDKWLTGILDDTSKVIANSTDKVDNSSRFNQECVNDELDWMSNTEQKQVIESCEAFFEKTGIQPYIVLADYSELPGVVINKGNNNTVLKTLIIAVAVIVVIVLLINWWKKKQQDQKEDEERAQKMLETPLEKFGDTSDPEINDLIDKYTDDNSSNN